MKSVGSTGIALLSGVFLLCACVAGRPRGEPSQDPASLREEVQVWREFVDLLSTAPFPANKVAPYHEDLRAPMLGFLSTMSSKADWKEWRRDPEVFRVGDQVHFLLPLTFEGHTVSYCFSFVIAKGAWFFQHLEAISLRLDRLGPLPAMHFPDLAEPDKAWIREEVQVSRDVWMFNTLAAEKGRDSALAWFRDGAGYALAARALVPFERPSRAFILYLCWEQANLHGNAVVLERLDDDRAVVRLKPLYFRLYEQAAHIKQQIQPEDYRALFEFRWQDRARNAGWNLHISYEASDCVFQFSSSEQ